MRVTMNDLAKELATTQATVSRALSNDPKISAEMQRKVREAADRLGYRPNLLARSLVSGKTKTIGTLMSCFCNEMATAKVLSLGQCLRAKGYESYVANIPDDSASHLHYAQEMISRGVDGLIVYGYSASKEWQELANLSVPTIFFDSGEDFPCSQVYQDRSTAIRKSAEHLYSLGHREMFLIYNQWSSMNDVMLNSRFAGLFDFIETKGLGEPGDRAIKVSGPFMQLDDGRNIVDIKIVNEHLQAFLATHPECTALICSSDEMALTVMSCLHRMGISVPDEISVVGFDNITAANYFYPRLSTVAQPIKKIAKSVVDLLLERIDGEEAAPKTVTITSEFVPRESTAKVRSKKLLEI